MFQRSRFLALFLCTVAASLIPKPPASLHADGYQVVSTSIRTIPVHSRKG
jgi:hypothetical protein